MSGYAAAAGSLIGGFINKINNSETNAANRDIADANNRFNEKMWKMQMRYNSPVSARKRLLAAGINPNMALASSDGGIASSAPVADTSGTQVADTTTGSIIANGFQQFAQLKQNQKAIDSSSRLQDSQASLNEIDAASRAAKNIAEINKMVKDGDLTSMQAYNLSRQTDLLNDTYDSQVENAKKQNEKLDADVQLALDNAALVRVEKSIREVDLKFANRKAQLEITKAIHEIRLIAAQEGWTLQDTRKALEETLNAAEQRGVIKATQENIQWSSGKLAADILETNKDIESKSVEIQRQQQDFEDSHSLPNRIWRWLGTSGSSAAIGIGAGAYTLGKGKILKPKSVKGFRK